MHKSCIIAHDYMEHTDGGSRLCLDLAQALRADMLCGFVRGGHPYWQGVNNVKLHTLIPALPIPLARQIALALAFRHKSRILCEYKTAFFSGAYASLGVFQRPGLHNILYCHTPPRFLYDAHDLFVQGLPAPARPLFQAFCAWLRPRYEEAARRMDIVVANSQAVQERIQRYLGLPSVLVAPPVKVASYYWEKAQGYYLSMVRLDPLKRVDVLIEAFSRMPEVRLLITSSGPEEARLKTLARDYQNIVFMGMLAEAERRQVLSQCVASICVAREEDFGMCAVESLAAGKPVIAAKAGGLAEIIQHEATGLLLSAQPNAHEVIEAVQRLGAGQAEKMRADCESQAKNYDLSRFVAAMEALCH